VTGDPWSGDYLPDGTPVVEWPVVKMPGTDAGVAAAEQRGHPVTDVEEKTGKASAAALLVDLALERYRFGVTPEGEPFAVPLPHGHVA
jgi:hypothetical protein